MGSEKNGMNLNPFLGHAVVPSPFRIDLRYFITSSVVPNAGASGSAKKFDKSTI